MSVLINWLLIDQSHGLWPRYPDLRNYDVINPWHFKSTCIPINVQHRIGQWIPAPSQLYSDCPFFNSPLHSSARIYVHSTGNSLCLLLELSKSQPSHSTLKSSNDVMETKCNICISPFRRLSTSEFGYCPCALRQCHIYLNSLQKHLIQQILRL